VSKSIFLSRTEHSGVYFADISLENVRAEVSRIFRGSSVSGHFAEASSADWTTKEGCGNVLTGALGSAEVDIGHCWRVLKHLDVTCGAFAEVSLTDWSAKKGRGNVLTGALGVPEVD
jgi:hypothetical protein